MSSDVRGSAGRSPTNEEETETIWDDPKARFAPSYQGRDWLDFVDEYVIRVQAAMSAA
jgi:hypothetical protein